MSVPVWGIILSDPLLVIGLVGRYPTNYLMSRSPLLQPLKFLCLVLIKAKLCGISTPFGMLSPAEGQVSYVLRTRSPLGLATPLDLHVLGTPPAFILSQDQTLHRIDFLSYIFLPDTACTAPQANVRVSSTHH